MSIYSAVFDEFKGVFGRAYVLTGLLPGLLLTFGVSGYFQSGGDAAYFVKIATELNSDALSTFAGHGIIALLAGLILFAARANIAYSFEHLPQRAFAPIRNWLIHRMTQRSLRLRKRQDTNAMFNTIFEAWVPGTQPIAEKLLPDGERVPTAEQMKAAHAGGLQVFSRARLAYWHGKVPSRRQYRKIREALRLLWVYSTRSDSNDSSTMLEEWRAELKKERGQKVWGVFIDYSHRDHVAAVNERKAFPDESRWIKPTLLGTKAAALDDYAEKRYGIHTSALLSRLFGVLSDEQRKALVDARMAMEVALNISFVALLVVAIVVINSMVVVATHARALDNASVAIDWLGAVIVIVALLLARIAYRAAVYAFEAFAEKVRRAVDLNRIKLIKNLGLPIPATMSDERRLWKELRYFFAVGSPLKPDPPITLPE